jgi:hypothetical protein
MTGLKCTIPPADDISAISIPGMAGGSGGQIRPGMWSPEMIYRVVTYDKASERMRGNLPIAPSVLREAKRIAGFQPQDDGLGEYLLNEEQTEKIANLLGFRPEPDRFFYYVEPYEPPEDSGLQQASEVEDQGGGDGC